MADKKTKPDTSGQDEGPKGAKTIRVGDTTLYVRREVGETFARIERSLKMSADKSKTA